ncbi:PIG-L family deacetylase [Pseudaminobacter soli (ex Li et al. 2025)]|uniref:PIG-L domain-containing protein n=1 Tax=Pseudaminobacter soli (ex Li et al. 2025) TaxID=1295366 RepID=A0A2P7S3N0_9HYPH|nr:PIG-L family deacetylase [Mesorhizobium soli]PSJ57076.1 PIG-L domain-containing protein [Mesorhizobium soli]
MLTARERIERQKANPALLRLHRALSRLQSTVTMMNTGAHPDDEQSGLLAYLRLGLGMRVIVACSTRGEGGQNSLGPERLGALGMLRTREMEEAARALDVDVVWLGHGPDDPVHDFGFSKDGDRTFDRWGEQRVVERLVRAYRSERPDIVVPTFLDVPGQHGHHRAMTRAAESAIRLAADPNAFTEHFDEGLAPWRVAKYYLPAWSGGGDTYDDEVPPPDTTVMVEALERDPATGAEYDRIGEWSRYYHASQGMGHWRETAKSRWPLHLLIANGKTGPEASVLEDLPATLGALAACHELPAPAAENLTVADEAIGKANAAFPARDAIISHLLEAARHLSEARAQASASFTALHGHRLERKAKEIDAALVEAAGIFERAVLSPATLAPGASATLTVDLAYDGAHPTVRIEPALPHGVAAETVTNTGSKHSFTITASGDAPYSSLYPAAWWALGGNGGSHIALEADFGNHTAHAVFDLEEPFAVQPANSISMEPEALIVPIDGSCRVWPVSPRVNGSAIAVSLVTGGGWTLAGNPESPLLRAPEVPVPGLTSVTPHVDGREAFRLTPIAYAHVGRLTYRQPEALRVLTLDLKLPQGARIGYVGGGADRVGIWLSRMGLDVAELDAQELGGDLSQYTTIVVGIFAFGLRKDLAAATQRLHTFVEDGGHLITLYHRPSDGWNPLATPPRRLEIGTPSLRWRVTDRDAEVTVLEPDHMLLNSPNKINAEDWTGWDKERGLYFASRWDEAYTPLLSMHDANEQPLTGALVSATIGAGRHTHTSLVLHHQMDRLVPGAFRLMANLVQPA